MDLLEQLARTNADPALIAQLRAVLAQNQEQISAQESQLAERDFKIKALTLELAHHRPPAVPPDLPRIEHRHESAPCQCGSPYPSAVRLPAGCGAATAERQVGAVATAAVLPACR